MNHYNILIFYLIVYQQFSVVCGIKTYNFKKIRTLTIKYHFYLISICSNIRNVFSFTKIQFYYYIFNEPELILFLVMVEQINKIQINYLKIVLTYFNYLLMIFI